MSEPFRIAIVGSGPSGLSCAARAAEHGLSHVLLEAERHPCHTIFQYQKGKHVMAEPGNLPLRSPMSFAAGRREEILARWNDEIRKHRVNLRLGARVSAISGERGAFRVAVADGEEVMAEHVVLCIGTQGNLRKLGVSGQDLERVQYQLEDAEAFSGEVILVVGAGDAAIENALALAEQNRVILVNRNDEFTRCKQGNLDLVLAAIRDGKLECRYGSKPLRIEAQETEGRPARMVLQTPLGEETIACDRVIARLGATPQRALVESFGVEFAGPDAAASPRLSARYESNIPGLYVIGMLAGQPLIKPGMNQGYEVVEHILGNPIKPADEPILEARFHAYWKAESVDEALRRVQRNVPLFAELTTLQLREVMLESNVLAPAAGEVIFVKNDYSNSFISILEGEVQVEVPARDQGKTGVLSLRRGNFVGEMGLLSGRRRSNTVRAGEGCVLIETPRRTMLRLMASVPAVRRIIDTVSLKRAVRAHVAPWLPEADLDQIVGDAEIRSFRPGETIFKEGDVPDGLHLVRRGSVTVSRVLGGREVVLNYIAAGNYFGEMALLSEAARSASIKAAVATETILLKAKTFNEVLMRNTTLRGGIQAEALQRMAQSARQADETDPGNIISFLMQQGIGEATDVLLIDESLCIRCDNCEKACADSHDGTSRLDRETGPTFANIHVPTSCRHCENPQCMKDCPPDAIRRNADGEVYIQDTCIGCGNCERNCPYGVIQMGYATSSWRVHPSLWSWLLLGIGAEPGREPKTKAKGQAKKAVKCDMCKDLAGGAACVRACPTGAAIRVSPEAFLEYTGSK